MGHQHSITRAATMAARLTCPEGVVVNTELLVVGTLVVRVSDRDGHTMEVVVEGHPQGVVECALLLPHLLPTLFLVPSTLGLGKYRRDPVEGELRSSQHLLGLGTGQKVPHLRG